MTVFFILDSAIGKAGEVKEVAEGYANNFLIPKKIALAYDDSISSRLEDIEKKKNKIEKKTSVLFKEIEDLQIVIPVTVKNEILYGSVCQNEIAHFLSGHGISVKKTQVLLDKPIKKLGLFKVPIRLSHSLIPLLRIKVVAKQ